MSVSSLQQNNIWMNETTALHSSFEKKCTFENNFLVGFLYVFKWFVIGFFFDRASVWSDKNTMTKHRKGWGASWLKCIPQTSFHKRHKTSKQKQTGDDWAAELSLWVGAPNEDTGLIMGALYWAWWLRVLQPEEKAFYCLVTQHQQMCLHNLYYLSLTSCQHVCVETIEGLP